MQIIETKPSKKMELEEKVLHFFLKNEEKVGAPVKAYV